MCVVKKKKSEVLWSNHSCKSAGEELPEAKAELFLWGFKATKPKSFQSLWHSTANSVSVFRELKLTKLLVVWFLEYAFASTSSPVHIDVVNNGQLEQSTLSAQGWIPTSVGLRLAGGLNERVLYTPAPMCCWCFVVVKKCFQPAQHCS